jgi:hypothetical protein
LKFERWRLRVLLWVVAVPAAMVLLLGLVMCPSANMETVQRAVSPDGKYWVEVEVDRGSALKSDWYFASIGTTHPTWTGRLRDGTSAELASLQSWGQLSVFWSAPREVTVVCSACDAQTFRTGPQSWQGIKVRYATYY